ncbi:hypothetical protein NL676_038136 [Syzygium grande]|nr:hypothetical protein NL676_038136 [Syzygium grande]
MAVGLPLVNPYLGKNLSFEHGVNFAVAGSTVLNSSFYAARNVTVPASDVPLRLQFNWFRNHLNSTCESQTGMPIFLVWRRIAVSQSTTTSTKSSRNYLVPHRVKGNKLLHT